jgi:hypothetical protein
MKPYLFLMFFLISCAGCRPNGNQRPDSPVCTPVVDREYFECTDSRGDFREPVDNIIGTTLDGYLVLEGYVDQIEKENKKLKRLCGRKCQ